MTSALPRIVAVMNQTHDVGKTFITAHLAAALAEQGISVLLIDLDPQADLSRALNISDMPSGIAEALLGKTDLVSIMQPLSTHLTVISSGNLLADFEQSDLDAMTLANRLTELLQQLPAGKVDLVLLDCAAISGHLGMNAVMSASDILVPVMAESRAMQGMINMLPVIKRVSRLRKTALRFWLCLNRLPRGNDLSDRFSKTMSQYFPQRLLQTVIFEQDASHTSVYHTLALDLLMGRTAS